MVEVNVAEGRLEGELIENEYGGSFYSFKGIPYAEPPVGDLRFKAPRPKQPWEGVRSAKEFGPICFQSGRQSGGSEDCLYLNVYTPDTKPAKSLPVMFWVHGGAFVSGSGNDDLHGPQFLVRKDVILVTCNYRLEVLGFLCLHTKDIPGNAGMKDQVAALRWVKKNISNFGGDPENITIFGESAGGASIAYHLVSPMTKGLFKRAIVQSGSLTSYWAQCWEARERALALARNLGCHSNDDKELYELFKSTPKESLINTNIAFTLATAAIGIFDITFSIVSEENFGDEERFFYGDVFDTLRNGIHEGVEVMMGFTSDEGLVNLIGIQDMEKYLNTVNNFHEAYVPKHIALNTPVKKQIEIGRKFKEMYDNKSENALFSISNFTSLNMFVYPMIQLGKFSARQNNKVYMYKFTCKSERNIFATVVMGLGKHIGDKPVTCHADDVAYIFNLGLMNQKVDTESLGFKLIDRVTSLWTNFAKYGNPTPDGTLGVKWSPYTLEEQDYMEIGNQLIPGKAVDNEEIQFWEDMFKEYFPQGICHPKCGFKNTFKKLF